MVGDDPANLNFEFGTDRAREDPHPHLKAFFEFLDDFNKETERGAAMASVAYIDDLMRDILDAFLVPNEGKKALLRGFNAPLGTLSARSAACFAMGLITDKEKSECDRLRDIRNLFAHRVKVSFSDQKLRDLCANLTMSAKDYGDVRVDPRGQFTTSAVAMILNLTNRPHYVSQKALKTGEWPY